MGALVFSGHETFNCRQFWLKKGIDFLLDGGKFRDKDAVVKLGVGKNMVSSISFWLQAFGLVKQGEITTFGNFLFGENAVDPFLENPASIWLLHYFLVNTQHASIYEIIFNQIKAERIEFDRAYIEKIIAANLKESGRTVSPHSIKNDINTFRKNYVRPSKVKNIEDDLSSLMIEIDLVKERKENKESVFIIEHIERPSLPAELVLFAILQHPNNREKQAIPFEDMLNGDLSVGRIFALNTIGLLNKLEEISDIYPSVVYSSDGGIQQIMLNDTSIREQPFDILTSIYG